MENILFCNSYKIDLIKDNIINMLNNFGFDFSLTGTKYIQDILFENIKNCENDFDCLATSMRSLADKYNVKLKSLNRDIRWSLEKNIFDLDIFLRHDDYYIATKNIILWLFDFFKFF